MYSDELILRCYAKKEGRQWCAYCLDLCLAAQAESFDSAKRKLESMIVEYIYDATVGEDKLYASSLLSRRASFVEWLKYYLIKLLCRIHQTKDGMYKLFPEVLPLIPAKP